MIAIAATLALLGAAQAGPPIDPFLPEVLRPAVIEASKAELDPKRGPNNAVQILEAEKAKATSREHATALDLRIAATRLRARFLAASEFPKGQRLEQALSTFARLDLAEPGLAEWIDRALAENPDVAKKLGKRKAWKLRAAILTRSAGLPRDAAERAFADALARAGVKLELVPAKEAPIVLTLGAEDVPRPSSGDTAVKVTLALETIEGDRVTWKNALYRVEAAKDHAVALRSSLDWLARIGGRDVFFRWLGDRGFPLLADPMAQHKSGHDGHGH